MMTSEQGGLSFHLHHDNAGWPTDSNEYRFGTWSSEQVELRVRKSADRLLHVHGWLAPNRSFHLNSTLHGVADGCFVVITWSADVAQLFMNGVEWDKASIQTNQKSMDRPAGHKVNHYLMPLIETDSVPTREDLFLQTLLDLEVAASIGKYMLLVRASATLRQLLIDGHRLIDQVNQHHRIKLTFRVKDVWTPLEHRHMRNRPAVTALGASLEPDRTYPVGDVKDMSLDEFLKIPILFVKAERFSIADIIRYLSHIEGGVHIGRPKTPADERLVALRDLRINNTPLAVRQMVPIINVVLAGLRPLRLAVASNNNS